MKVIDSLRLYRLMRLFIFAFTSFGERYHKLPPILTARAVNNADYQVFTEKTLADVGMPWQRSAIGDGKLCLTAGKPQSGAACGKSAAINMCLEVAQHCSTSSTPIYCVGFLLRRFRCATPAVKHSKAPSALSSQYI